MEIYGELKKDIGWILRKLCDEKGIEIIQADACPDHVHMLVSIPPKYSVSSIMGFLKGKSSLMIFDRHANLKYKYGNRTFWAQGYYVDTVGRNKEKIKEYIKNQLEQDQMLFDTRCYIKLNGCVGNFLTAFRVIKRISDICRSRAQTGNAAIAVWQLANGRDAVTRRCHSANFDMSTSYQLYANVINVPGGHCVRSGIHSDCTVISSSVVAQCAAWQINQILSDHTEAIIIHTCIGGSGRILLTTNDKIMIKGALAIIIPFRIRYCVKLTNNVYIFIRENNAFQVNTIYKGAFH